VVVGSCVHVFSDLGRSMEGEVSDQYDEYHESKEDLTSASSSDSLDDEQQGGRGDYNHRKKVQNRPAMMAATVSGQERPPLGPPLPTSIPNSLYGRITLGASRTGDNASSSKWDSKTSEGSIDLVMDLVLCQNLCPVLNLRLRTLMQQRD
jgi:hypothetical protein